MSLIINVNLSLNLKPIKPEGGARMGNRNNIEIIVNEDIKVVQPSGSPSRLIPFIY